MKLYIGRKSWKCFKLICHSFRRIFWRLVVAGAVALSRLLGTCSSQTSRVLWLAQQLTSYAFGRLQKAMRYASLFSRIRSDFEPQHTLAVHDFGSPFQARNFLLFRVPDPPTLVVHLMERHTNAMQSWLSFWVIWDESLLTCPCLESLQKQFNICAWQHTWDHYNFWPTAHKHAVEMHQGSSAQPSWLLIGSILKEELQPNVFASFQSVCVQLWSLSDVQLVHSEASAWKSILLSGHSHICCNVPGGESRGCKAYDGLDRHPSAFGACSQLCISFFLLCKQIFVMDTNAWFKIVDLVTS